MKDIIINAINEYKLSGKSYRPISSKSAQVVCNQGECVFIKKTNLFTDDKYKFLSSQKNMNILYPIENKRGNYTSKTDSEFYYVMPYYNETKMIDEIKISHLNKELSNLHHQTYYRKELTPLTSRKKLEDLYEYLQYKFNTLEAFVRTIEAREYDEYSILILKDYHYILDAKKIMGKLNKKIIDDIKAKKSINHSFIHNNPKLNHLINFEGNDYLISIERSKIGIPSLDIAKLYIETEDIKVNRHEMIVDYFNQYDDSFYYDYFVFYVLLYYIKSIVIIDKDYVSTQSFVYASGEIKRFMEDFKLKNEL